MKTEEKFKELAQITARQLRNFWDLGDNEEAKLLSAEAAYEKTIYCLSNTKNKYFQGYVDPCHSVMYCIWLYWLSRYVYETSGGSLADKVYYLNKVMHSVDILYAVELPRQWSCEHPLGSVMGRAKYSDGFFFNQGCTVGGNYDRLGNLYYPVIGKNVTMHSNAKILGKSIIGDNCIISANTYIINAEIPNNSMIFGCSPSLIIKKNNRI